MAEITLRIAEIDRQGLGYGGNRHVERVFNPDRKDHHWGAAE